MRDTAIVLAMHGAPPSDFPRSEIGQFMGLHAQVEHAQGAARKALQARYAELEGRILTWPRTTSNDPFWASSLELGRRLQQHTGLPVFVGFNEFCAPSLGETLEQAVASGARHIVVVTPMLTRGGEHAEHDIPEVIQTVQRRHPGTSIVYAWPYETDEIVRMLAAQVGRAPGRSVLDQAGDSK